jgi:hypothetical protein
MAWYWPTIEDESSAEAATKPAVGASGFFAAVTGLIAILSIVYHRPVFGFSGWSLVDALLFVVIAWRIKQMSRTWAVLGLLIYLLEVSFNVATNKNGAIGVMTVIFVLTYIGAIRGTFAFHRYRRMTNAAQSPPAMGIT